MTNSLNLRVPRTASSQQLQRSLGIIAMALPAVLWIGGVIVDHVGLRDSISDYYYTHLVGVLVGSLCAFAVILASYRGYDDRDNRATNLAAVLIAAVALCPTTPASGGGKLSQAVGAAHYLAAAGFFLTMAWIAAKLFTLTRPDSRPTVRKGHRNTLYVVCALLIIASTAAILVVDLLHAQGGISHAVFWLETLAVESFGVAWMTKSGAWLRDRPLESRI